MSETLLGVGVWEGAGPYNSSEVTRDAKGLQLLFPEQELKCPALLLCIGLLLPHPRILTPSALSAGTTYRTYRLGDCLVARSGQVGMVNSLLDINFCWGGSPHT